MTSYSIPQDILVQEVVSETVLLDASRGEYFELNEMGSEMLRRLDRYDGDPERVIISLLEDYDVSRERLERDFAELLENLLAHGLISRKDG